MLIDVWEGSKYASFLYKTIVFNEPIILYKIIVFGEPIIF